MYVNNTLLNTLWHIGHVDMYRWDHSFFYFHLKTKHKAIRSIYTIVYIVDCVVLAIFLKLLYIVQCAKEMKSRVCTFKLCLLILKLY